jgi:hypothetical protein
MSEITNLLELATFFNQNNIDYNKADIASFACSNNTIYLDEPIAQEDADWCLIIDGDGQKPLAEISYKLIKELQNKNIITKNNTYIGYKPHVIFSFLKKLNASKPIL